MRHIKDLLESKKFRVTLAGALAAIIGAIVGAQSWEVAMQEVVAVAAIYVGAQGIADHGKEKEKERQKGNK